MRHGKSKLHSDLEKMVEMHIKAFIGRNALMWIQTLYAKEYDNH